MEGDRVSEHEVILVSYWRSEAEKFKKTAGTFYNHCKTLESEIGKMYQRVLDQEAKLRDLKHRIKHGYEITKEELNRDE